MQHKSEKVMDLASYYPQRDFALLHGMRDDKLKSGILSDLAAVNSLGPGDAYIRR